MSPLPSTAVLAEPALWAGAAVAAAATPALAALGRRRGWLDRPDGAGGRKRQARPVPPVGGAAVLLGLAAAFAAIRLGGGHWDPLVAAWIHPAAGALALVLAVVAGAVDDLAPRGLRPRAKVALQALAAAPVAASVALHAAGEGAGPAAALGLAAAAFAAAVLAQNAFNTFDNADGCSTSLGIAALAVHAPVLAGALVGFLPFNLVRRRGAPVAYLGDAGSHLLGVLVLLVPAAWPAFALPLLDLGRVAARRARDGAPWWVGDRRHLAHRLAAAGVSRLGVPALLVALALPGIALSPAGVGPGLAGCAATALLFTAAVRASAGAERAAASGRDALEPRR